MGPHLDIFLNFVDPPGGKKIWKNIFLNIMTLFKFEVIWSNGLRTVSI